MSATDFYAALDSVPFPESERVAQLSGLQPADKARVLAACRAGHALRPKLRGERGGVSVYLIALSDGTAYVGITSRGIAERFAEHVGFEPERRDFPNGPNLAIVNRLRDGCTVKVSCLASDLTRAQARDRESSEIAKLARPLNAMGVL